MSDPTPGSWIGHPVEDGEDDRRLHCCHDPLWKVEDPIDESTHSEQRGGALVDIDRHHLIAPASKPWDLGGKASEQAYWDGVEVLDMSVRE